MEYAHPTYPMDARTVGLCRLDSVRYVGAGFHGDIAELLGTQGENEEGER